MIEWLSQTGPVGVEMVGMRSAFSLWRINEERNAVGSSLARSEEILAQAARESRSAAKASLRAVVARDTCGWEGCKEDANVNSLIASSTREVCLRWYMEAQRVTMDLILSHEWKTCASERERNGESRWWRERRKGGEAMLRERRDMRKIGDALRGGLRGEAKRSEWSERLVGRTEQVKGWGCVE
jgi:hypothetical protein